VKKVGRKRAILAPARDGFETKKPPGAFESTRRLRDPDLCTGLPRRSAARFHRAKAGLFAHAGGLLLAQLLGPIAQHVGFFHQLGLFLRVLFEVRLESKEQPF